MQSIIYGGFSSPVEADLAGLSPAWVEYPATPEGLERLRKDGRTAVPTYEFSGPVIQGKPRPVTYGDLLLDFDAKTWIADENGNKQPVGDIEKALRGITNFIHILVGKFGVNPADLSIWASGGKGFHLKIPRELIGSEKGDTQLPQIYNAMLHRLLHNWENVELWNEDVNEALRKSPTPTLQDFCIDSSSFKQGKGQLIRLPHIQRPDGNYKVPVTYQELMDRDEGYFKELVKRDRTLPEENTQKSLQTNKELEKLYMEEKKFLHTGTPATKREDGGNTFAMDTQCAFLAHCRDSAEGLPEPEWFMLAKILAHSGNMGRVLFHEDSQRDKARYDRKKADEVIHRAYQYPMPTCQQIKQIYDCGKDCGVKCPIDLFSHTQSKTTLLENYLVDETGLFYLEEVKGDTIKLKISTPVEVVAYARDVRNSSWAKIVVFADPDGNEHRCIIQNTELIGKPEDALTPLVNEGLEIESGNKAKRLLAEFIHMSRPEARGLIVEKNGWADDTYTAYIPLDLGFQEGSNVYFVKRNNTTNSTYTQNGTLQDWKDKIAIPCRGNPLLMICIIMGLAGPMLRMLDRPGFGINLYGLTSSGKTTALAVGASVNGAEVHKWRTTDNALETVGEAHNDNTLFLDELSESDPDALSYSVYMLASGKGKLRNTKTGENRRMLNWRELFVSTGEKTIADRANEGRRNSAMGGHEVRAIDLEAEGGTDIGIFTQLPAGYNANGFAVYLNDMSQLYKGMAIVELIEYLKNDQDTAIQMVKSFEAQFLARFDQSPLNGPSGRVLRNLGFLAGVGELAISIGIFPWNAGEAADCVEFCFKKWQRRANGTPVEIQKALDKLRELIENDFYGQIGKFHQVVEVSAHGHECYHISREYFIHHVCPEYLYKEVIKELRLMGVLILTKSGDPRRNTHLNNGTRTPNGICIKIEEFLHRGDTAQKPDIRSFLCDGGHSDIGDVF